MNLSHYQQLPDGMSASEIAAEFEMLLSEAEKPGVLCVPVLEAFWELADRQWHTYELLRPDLRIRIEEWLKQNWLHDEKFLCWVGGVIGNLGLTGAMPMVEQTANNFEGMPLGLQARKIIEELRANIEDPFWSLRGSRN